MAYYYPQPYWRAGEGDWLKSLLLFFDGIAILRPRYMRGIESAADPFLAGPMKEQGLLQVLEPESFLDQTMTENLTETLTALVTGGAFDALDKSAHYQELSRSRLGWDADITLAKNLIKELTRRGLAKKSEDGVSVPLHPAVRTTVLVLLSQLARPRGHRIGVDLHPVTGDADVLRSMSKVLDLPTMPSEGHVVAFDLETVGVDLSAVPLDDILSFKSAYGDEHRAYARDLRRFLADINDAEPGDRDKLLSDRREELAERAHQLRQGVLKTWRKPAASVGLGLAGAVWNASRGDVFAAALSIACGIVGANVNRPQAGAYSYLFRVRDTLSSGGDRHPGMW